MKLSAILYTARSSKTNMGYKLRCLVFIVLIMYSWPGKYIHKQSKTHNRF